MRGAVELRTDGCTDLQMDSNKQYIVTSGMAAVWLFLKKPLFRNISGDWIRISRIMVMDRV